MRIKTSKSYHSQLAKSKHPIAWFERKLWMVGELTNFSAIWWDSCLPWPHSILCSHRPTDRIPFKLYLSHKVKPLLWGHPFCIRKVAFQEGWPLVRGRNQYIYIVKWPFQRGWPLVRVASQKGFHCNTFCAMVKIDNHKWSIRSSLSCQKPFNSTKSHTLSDWALALINFTNVIKLEKILHDFVI